MLYSLLLLNIVCTAIPLLSDNKVKGLKWSFLILFVFLALRYDFGNDYPAYYRMFYNFDLQGLLDERIEYGYALLVTSFKPLGFFALVSFGSAIYCTALYLTVKRYVPAEYYWLVMMSVISNADLVFYGASAIRQTLAFSIILFSFPFLEKKKAIYYLALVVLASLFHKSALSFVILYPLMYLNLRNKTFIIIFGLLALAVMTVLQSAFENFMNLVAAANFDKYMDRYGDSDQVLEGGLMGTIIRIIFMIVFLWSMAYERSRLKSIFLVLGVICIVIFTMRNLVSLQRFTMYYGYMMAFSLAYALQLIKHKSKKLYFPFLAIVLIWNINMAFVFASVKDSLFEYHTIFESKSHHIPLS